MEFDRDLRARQEVRLLAQQAQQAQLLHFLSPVAAESAERSPLPVRVTLAPSRLAKAIPAASSASDVH